MPSSLISPESKVSTTRGAQIHEREAGFDTQILFAVFQCLTFNFPQVVRIRFLGTSASDKSENLRLEGAGCEILDDYITSSVAGHPRWLLEVDEDVILVRHDHLVQDVFK